MKFGILTFFNENNYGAVLQAYALQQRICSAGYENEFIDYINHFPSKNSKQNNRIVKYVCKIRILLNFYKYLKIKSSIRGNKSRFEKFRQSYLKISHQKLYDEDDLRNISPEYQGFIAGSDMVWTPIGQDLNYYFMRFTSPEKRLSYAASLTGVNQFDNATDKQISQYISEVCSIACREKEGVDYVLNKTGKHASLTIDPTLLLTKEEWLTTLDIKENSGGYILCYMFKGLPKKLSREINRISKEKQLEVRYVPMNVGEYYKEVNNGHSGAYGPKEFVELFMNASFVVTNSFHGFLFSLIAQKPFVVIHREKGNAWKSNEGRISNLLEIIGLGYRYIDGTDRLDDDLLRLDFSNVNEKIERLRNSSITYLQDMLKKAIEKDWPIRKQILTKVTDLKDKQCTGCETCVSACPKGCILMIPDKEGFKYPSIDSKLCVDCGRCVSTCPSIVECAFGNFPHEAFAALSKLKEVENSASGGLFITAAKYIIERCRGVVFGVVLDAQTYECRFEDTETTEGLYPMQNSKYIQANVNGAYGKVKNYLISGRTVLFSGTPCQVAGLKTYLGKEYDNLYTVDIICHGVPSQKYWEKYIKNTFPGNSLLSYRFRNRDAKRHGRTSLECVSITGGGRIEKNAWEDVFYGSFVENESFRKSCYYCKFANGKRCGDLTMGDFDSTYQLPDFYPSECKSLILINNNQGRKLWNLISCYFDKKNISFDEEAKVNVTLSNPSPMPNARKTLYKDMDLLTWKNFSKKYSHKVSLIKKIKGIVIKVISK